MKNIPDQFFDQKYDSRNNRQAGEYRGVGENGKYGFKRGQSDEEKNSSKMMPEGKPPKTYL